VPFVPAALHRSQHAPAPLQTQAPGACGSSRAPMSPRTNARTAVGRGRHPHHNRSTRGGAGREGARLIHIPGQSSLGRVYCTEFTWC
jgi:hypothetical protein